MKKPIPKKKQKELIRQFLSEKEAEGATYREIAERIGYTEDYLISVMNGRDAFSRKLAAALMSSRWIDYDPSVL